MIKDRRECFTCKENILIVDAMGMIDANANGILFVVDNEERLIGCISDGDIRRWLIKTGDLQASIDNAMQENPTFLSERDANKAEEVMRSKIITAIPVVDELRRIKDIVLLKELGNGIQGNISDALQGVPVVVMAGGKGERLFPYTKILPKPLIPIGETPIVERIMSEYCKFGVNRFYMTVNYKKGMIKSYFNDSDSGFEICYVEEEKPLGTGGSIKLIDEIFDKPIFITNCDALILADYENIYDYHKKSGNIVTIVSALKNIAVPYGVLHSGENGEVVSMEEKPRLSYFINTGMYVINPEIIEMIPDNQVFHMTQLVDKVMQNGGKVGMYPISEDSFLDMGEFSEMKRMEEKLQIVSE